MKLYTLQDCYRCSTEICAAANALTSHLKDGLTQQNISVIGSKGPVVARPFKTAQEELANISATLSIRNSLGTCSFNDSAVLLRTNALVDFPQRPARRRYPRQSTQVRRQT